MSFYTSLNGLKNAQTQLGVVAHNIANVKTTGFKKSTVQFADIVAGSALSDPRKIQGLGATVEAISQNYSLGPIEQTGSALDIAINGDGFFSTKSALSGQTQFTRNGAFTVDDAGFIQDGSDKANLVRYQQAFQASGRAMQVASDIFDTLLGIG
jgi:flagellar hook protein FlgE